MLAWKANSKISKMNLIFIPCASTILNPLPAGIFKYKNGLQVCLPYLSLVGGVHRTILIQQNGSSINPPFGCCAIQGCPKVGIPVHYNLLASVMTQTLNKVAAHSKLNIGQTQLRYNSSTKQWSRFCSTNDL